MSARLAAILLVGAAACDRANQSLERMVDQPRVTAASPGRAAPTGTVAREAILNRPELTEGTGLGSGFPMRLTEEVLERGRERFEIYCTPCHGVSGTSETPIAERMSLRRPPSLHEPRIVALRPTDIYRVIHLGYGLMPSYDLQLSVEDRWAVAAYVKALQMSRAIPIVALPADLQQEASNALR